MPSRCSITGTVFARSREQYGHRLLNRLRTTSSYSSPSTLIGQPSLILRLNSWRNMLISLFATSDLARRVAERNCDVGSFISFDPLVAKRPRRLIHLRGLSVRSRAHVGDCFRFWQLRLDRAGCRVERGAPKEHPELVQVCNLAALQPRACQRCFFLWASCSQGESIFCTERKCSRLEHQGGGHVWGRVGVLFGVGKGIGNLTCIVRAHAAFVRRAARALAIYPSRTPAGADSRSG